jgi:tRNA-specific 2-thiouridylase
LIFHNAFFVELQRYKFIAIIHNLLSFIVLLPAMKPNQKVLLGMSGGTDSSVAALLLQDAGYEVTGVTFRFYEKDGNVEYLDDARALCASLGIPHLVYDARDVFRRTIIDYFIKEYMEGHTPVPCTLCNNYLKWPLLKQLADEMGIYYVATGHYVRKKQEDGYWYIQVGADCDKDQSFFLWGLPQDILERMILPMGGFTKTQVRQIASERGFVKAAQKKDSIGFLSYFQFPSIFFASICAVENSSFNSSL